MLRNLLLLIPAVIGLSAQAGIELKHANYAPISKDATTCPSVIPELDVQALIKSHFLYDEELYPDDENFRVTMENPNLFVYVIYSKQLAPDTLRVTVEVIDETHFRFTNELVPEKLGVMSAGLLCDAVYEARSSHASR